MFGHALRTTRAGIVVAERHGSERGVWDALVAHDPDLILTWEPDRHGRKVWRVMRYVSDSLPADFVCEWRDPKTGEPLELSYGLVEKLKGMDRNGRGGYVDPDEHNRRIDELADRENREIVEEASRDFIRANTKGLGHFSGPVKPSRALQLARARGRATGRSV